MTKLNHSYSVQTAAAKRERKSARSFILALVYGPQSKSDNSIQFGRPSFFPGNGQAPEPDAVLSVRNHLISLFPLTNWPVETRKAHLAAFDLAVRRAQDKARAKPAAQNSEPASVPLEWPEGGYETSTKIY